MTAEQLAQGQLHAAWVSAGAAIVQALGAVAAIVASIVLARGSAARERQAEASAAERERRADGAADRRAKEAREAALQQIEAADAAARRREAESAIAETQRSEQARAAAWNEQVTAAASLLQRALASLREELAEWRRLADSGVGSNFGAGSTQAAALAQIAEALGELRLRLPVDAHLRDVLSRAVSLLRPGALNWGMGRAAEIAPRVEARITELTAVLDDVDTERV